MMKKHSFSYSGFDVSYELYKKDGTYIADATIMVNSENGLRSLHILGKSHKDFDDAEDHVISAVKGWIDTRKL